MSTFNPCGGTGTGYWGTPICERPIGTLVKAIFTPRGEVIEYTSYAELLTNIQAGCLSGRYLPVQFSDLPTVNTAETNYVTSAFGDVQKGKEGKPDLTFKCKERDTDLLTQYRYANGSKLDVLFIDEYNSFNGVIGGDGGEGMLSAIGVELFDFKPLKIETGSTPYAMEMKIILQEPGALTELVKLAAYKTGKPIGSLINGNKEVVLYTKVGLAHKLYVCPVCPVDSEVIAATNSTALLLAGAWEATLDGATAIPTLAAATETFSIDGIDTVLDCIELTFTAAGAVTVQMTTPTALAALTTPLGSNAKGGYQNDIVATATIV